MLYNKSVSKLLEQKKGGIIMGLLQYEETFVSPFEKETREEAETVLEAIRSAHSAFNGWVEIEGYVEQLDNGRWRAVRHHKKI